jgi:hypothetical protein
MLENPGNPVPNGRLFSPPEINRLGGALLFFDAVPAIATAGYSQMRLRRKGSNPF